MNVTPYIKRNLFTKIHCGTGCNLYKSNYLSVGLHIPNLFFYSAFIVSESFLEEMKICNIEGRQDLYGKLLL